MIYILPFLETFSLKYPAAFFRFAVYMGRKVEGLGEIKIETKNKDVKYMYLRSRDIYNNISSWCP